MSIYGFRGGPVRRGASKQEQFMAALEMPMNPLATFFDQAKGGALESFGLGTVIRDFSIPQGTQRRDGGELVSGPVPNPLNPLSRLYEDVRGIVNPVQADATPMTQDEWKSSPYFRSDIPWDEGMTADRAAALAAWDDARKVREFYAQKRPIISFFGGLAGQAVDPINFIPIAGPAVKAAAVARAGRIGGAAITGAVDAAANTAAFSLLTAGARAEYGDDVSWQATISEVATAALIGTAFGGLSGALSARRARRLDAKLATLNETQEARAVLNDAINGLVRDGEVRLTPASFDILDGQRRSAVRFSPETSGFVPEADLSRSTAVGRVLEAEQSAPSIDIETPQFRQALADDPVLAERFESATSRLNEATERFEQITEDAPQPETVPNRAAAAVEAPASVAEPAPRSGEVVNEPRTTPEPDRADEVVQQAEQDLVVARREYVQVRNAVASRIPAVERRLEPAFPAFVARTAPAPDPLPTGSAEAEGRVGRSEKAAAVAEAHRVNPETGDFAEQADLERAEAEGRISDLDRKELAAADNDYEQGKAFGEALKGVVGCLL